MWGLRSVIYLALGLTIDLSGCGTLLFVEGDLNIVWDLSVCQRAE